MGCDIHFYVEKKAKNGKWIRAEAIIDNPYYDPKYDDPEDEYNEPKKAYESWYSGRNYRLFSVLSGVRTWGWENPLQMGEERGIPDNSSVSVKKEWKRGEGDWHTPGYFTLKELTEYEWDTPRLDIDGYLSPEQFYAYITDGYPDMWISKEDHERRPDRFEVISMMEMKDVLEEMTEEIKNDPPKVGRGQTVAEEFRWALFSKSFKKNVVCPFTTMVSPRQWVGDNNGRGFMATINTMKLLADAEFEGDRTKVRCVFWYDN
jgi:hypothetical protein